MVVQPVAALSIGKLAGLVARILASQIWAFFVVRMALRKRYSDFRVTLILEN